MAGILHGDLCSDHSRRILPLATRFDDGFTREINHPEVQRTQVRGLRQRPKLASNVPSIHVNDNFARSRSEFKIQIERCTAECAAGPAVARVLRSGENDPRTCTSY
jgi:hypothetical protein